MGKTSQISIPRAQPTKLKYWLICGALAGAVFASCYAALYVIFSNRDNRPIVAIYTIGMGAIVGAAFAAWQRGRSPSECYLATWIGLLSGLIPALLIGVAAGSVLEAIRRPITAAGIALVPAGIGFLIGGLAGSFFRAILVFFAHQKRELTSQAKRL